MSVRKDELTEINNKVDEVGNFFDIDYNYEEASNIYNEIDNCFELSYDIGVSLLEQEHGRPVDDFKMVDGPLSNILPSIEEYLGDNELRTGFTKQQLASLTILYSEVGNYVDEEIGDGNFERIGVEEYIKTKPEIKEDLKHQLEEVTDVLDEEEQVKSIY